MKKKIKKPKKHIVYRIVTASFTSLVLFVLIAIFYFLVLISVEYKSFPIINTEIENRINQNLPLGNSIKIGKSYLRFSHLYKIEVKLDDIKLTLDGKKDALLPKVEAEFSMFKLALGNLYPSRLKVIDPKIIIDNSSPSPSLGLGSSEKEAFGKEILEQLPQIFSLFKDGDILIKKFLISNAQITIKNKLGQQTILLKEAQIKTNISGEYLYLKSTNTISHDPSLPDLLIVSDCKFKKVEGLRCDIHFTEFSPALIATLHPKLLPLKQIVGDVSGDLILSIDDNLQPTNLSFNIKSTGGSFDYPQFFSKKIDFQNLSLEGGFNNSLNTFTINNLTSNFGNTKFSMSLLINNLFDRDRQKSMMKFDISDAKINDLEVLWPVFLSQYDVRKWVIEHIKDGQIKNAYAALTLQSRNGIDYLEKINSKVIFYGATIKYSESFPKISDIDGVASFSKQQMKIDVSTASVLESKINSASVVIPDFNASKIMLNIGGKVSGAAADSLKHISYNSEFSNQIEKYFNGEAITDLEIKLPLTQNLKLEDVYIKVGSNIAKFNNEYIAKNSDLLINTVKDFAGNDFVTEIDLTKADVDLPQFGIIKNKEVPSKIKTSISFRNPNYLQLKDFEWKQENSYIRGGLLLEIDPIQVTKLTLKNHNFGSNNFSLNYQNDKDLFLVKLKGKVLDLGHFFKEGSLGSKMGIDLNRENDIVIDLDKAYLANEQKISNIKVDINCIASVCKDGFIRASLAKEKNLNVLIFQSKDSKKSHPSEIKGVIDDVSIVAKAFDLSKHIVGGKTKIKAEVIDGQIRGELVIDSGFTILKNEVVEKISKNDVFANLKDKISNNNKIQFDDLKLELVLRSDVLDIKSLVASSYLMGFTAKGSINFGNNETALKGLIVPGYAINKLFGIGQIPILGKIIVGEKGGGVFAIRYDYTKKNNESNFNINPASALIPGGIRNVLDIL